MLQVFGINHHNTPLEIRERLSFTAQQLSEALHSLHQQPSVKEVVILSTCNRTEIYTNVLTQTCIARWLLQHKSIQDIDLRLFSYHYQNQSALKHLMRVATGLDSMILGEPQILGQLKEAYFTAEKNKTTRDIFKQLFPTVFSTSKIIRSNTSIGAQSVSLAYTITQLSRSIFNDLSSRRILLIGAGETIELIATHFYSQEIKQITIANRTLEKSHVIADKIDAAVILMREIPAVLNEYDIVISATASQLPILGKGMIESAMHLREKNPLLLVDLAVPRDIESEVKQLNNVYLYNIDDLQEIIAENKQHRQLAALEAESLIDFHADAFEKKMRIYQVRHVITQYREKLDAIRDSEYKKALRQLARGEDPAAVLESFSIKLINKIMHHPTMKIREAASEDQCIALQHMKEIL